MKFKQKFLLILLPLIIFSCAKKENKNQVNESKNECVVTFIEGKAALIDSSYAVIRVLNVGDSIIEENIIKTDKGSTAELEISNSSVVRIKENSILRISKLFKDKNIERTGLKLDIGKVLLKPKELTEGSSFEVNTNTITAGVRGTEFTVNSSAKETSVGVNNGKVYIINNMVSENKENLLIIKNFNKTVGENLEKAAGKEIVLVKNEKIIIDNEKYNAANDEIGKNIKALSQELESNKNSKTEIEKISANADIELVKNIESKNQILMRKNAATESEMKKDFNREEFDKLNKSSTKSAIENKERIEQKKEELRIDKVGNLGLKFSEKATSVTSNDKFIFISNDLDKNIYCVDISSGKVAWLFSDPKIVKIQSAIQPVTGNNLILSSFNNIIILNNQGKIILNQDLNNGVSYWAEPAFDAGTVYIPTARNIYTYNGSKIGEISSKSIPDAMSQQYISIENKVMFIADSLNKNIKAYSISEDKIIWASSKINGNILSAPKKVNNFLIVADAVKALYRFDYQSGKIEPDMLNIGTGVISNIISNGSMIYFVATNRNFYSVNVNSFGSFRKIAQVDKNPSQDKYLIKKLVKDKNLLYYASDTGSLFTYNLKEDKAGFIAIKENNSNTSLIGTPAVINNAVYLVDANSNIYKEYLSVK